MSSDPRGTREKNPEEGSSGWGFKIVIIIVAIGLIALIYVSQQNRRANQAAGTAEPSRYMAMQIDGVFYTFTRISDGIGLDGDMNYHYERQNLSTGDVATIPYVTDLTWVDSVGRFYYIDGKKLCSMDFDGNDRKVEWRSSWRSYGIQDIVATDEWINIEVIETKGGFRSPGLENSLHYGLDLKTGEVKKIFEVFDHTCFTGYNECFLYRNETDSDSVSVCNAETGETMSLDAMPHGIIAKGFYWYYDYENICRVPLDLGTRAKSQQLTDLEDFNVSNMIWTGSDFLVAHFVPRGTGGFYTLYLFNSDTFELTPIENSPEISDPTYLFADKNKYYVIDEGGVVLTGDIY